jgi:putative FmdB family regulatory protein
MPTYQYACTSCGERLEVVQKFSDDPLTVCPACSGALRKVFSPVGVVFKGSGFYKTDSRSKSTSSTPSSSSSTSSSGSTSSGSTSDGGSSSSSSDSTPSTGGSGDKKSGSSDKVA